MPDSEYLMHYKYVKRERKNNRWVYTYPDGSTHKVGRTLDTLGYHKKADAIDKLREAQSLSVIANDTDDSPKNANAYKKAQQEAMDATLEARSALKDYYNTPIGKLDKLDDKIDAGRNYLSKLLKNKLPKVANAIRPKEELITKLQKRR